MVKHFLIAAFISVMTGSLIAAASIPVIGLADLVQQSDIVALGRLTNVSTTGTGVVGGVTSRNLSATIYVDETIKGDIQGSSVRVRYVEPEEPIGYRGITADSYGIFFLRRSTEGVEFETPYYPYLVALPGFRTSAQSPTDRAFEVVANVLRSDGSAANKLEAISLLRETVNPIALDALRSAVGSNDQELALRAAAALLSVGDLSGLQRVETVLQGNRVGLSDETYLTVLGSLGALKEPSALTSLERLFARGDVGTRRAAVRSLRGLRLDAAIESLVRALDDDDFEVRHHAVIGLSEVSGQTQWGPSVDAFAEDERRFLNFWKDWAKRRR